MELRIMKDLDPQNPREEDNLGHMVCWHSNLGDDRPEGGFSEWLEQFPSSNEADEGYEMLSLYLYEHKGVLRMSTNPFVGPGVNTQVGYVYATWYRAQELGIDWFYPEKIRAQLRAEVARYHNYLRGACYGFEIWKGDTMLDSCYGFLGSDPRDMKDSLDPKFHHLLEKIRLP